MITQRDKYLLSFCTDFHDELLFAWFDRAALKKLFSLFHSWGMRRVYWIYLFKHAEGMFDCSPYKYAVQNACRTYEHTGEFLPAAVEIAHELGMECYAVYKPFDLGYHATFPYNTPEADKYGKIDCLSGRIYWAIESLVKLQDKRLQRHPADIPKNLDRTVIGTIKLFADREDQPVFGKDNLRLLVSGDNRIYQVYKKRYTFRHGIEKGYRAVFLENLEIKNPYLAIECRLPENRGTFANTLDKLVTLYDRKRVLIPFTYGLRPRALPWKKGPLSSPFPASLQKGFAFGHVNAPSHDGSLRIYRHAIDNSETGLTAMAKGKERYIHGMLSPAYPQVQKCWLGHIRECLDAGVDGVDIRAGSHSRSMEWERYGFEPPVVKEYKKRYGVDITKERFSTARHRALLGEFYTAFVKRASKLIRSYDKRVQIHIMPTEMDDSPHKRYHNFHCEWERWIMEGMVDAITIKDGPWVDESVWNRIDRHSRKPRIPVYHCPYWKSVVTKTQWQKKFRQTLEDSLAWGQAGLILYESAMVTRVTGKGRIKLLYPDIPGILEGFCKAHGGVGR